MDRRRRALLAAALGSLAATRAAALSTPARVVYTIPRRSDQLQKWYAEAGLVHGRDIDLVFAGLYGLADPQMEARAREVLASNPKVIVAQGWRPVFLLQKLTSTVPVLFVNFGGDPVRFGLVESLRRPGRNMTGTCQQLMSLVPKFFEVLRELKPGGRRGGVLITQATTGSRHGAQGREETARASKLLGMEIVDVVAPDNPTLAQAIAAIEKAHVDYLFVPEDVYDSAILHELFAYLERARLPALYLYSSLVRKGGLASMSFDIAEGHKAAIDMVARILKGESPATMPVYLSTRYQIAINRRTARAMGIEVPASLLARAEELVD